MDQNIPIDINTAKRELERINVFLSEPHLLIGGLAVNQYMVSRKSADLDIICTFGTATEIIDELYPSSDWTVTDRNNDEYRPSYCITHRVGESGEIILGPKILERQPYPKVDWTLVGLGAYPFKGIGGKVLEKILVPTPHSLAYLKFISFLGRESNKDVRDKVKQDLKDFCNLTNQENFSLAGFHDLLRKQCTDAERSLLWRDFFNKAEPYESILMGSSLFAISDMVKFASSAKTSKLVYELHMIEKIIDTIKIFITLERFDSKEAIKFREKDVREFTRQEIDANSLFRNKGDFEDLFKKLFTAIYE